MFRILALLSFVSLTGFHSMSTSTALAGDEGYIKVEVKGVLKTGIFAIGGETTGTIITTKKGTLELDLGKDKNLRAQAEKLNGKSVVVTGNLSIRKGVEVRQRLIVSVATLKAGGD
jgi:hypothetical protein